MMDQRTLNIIYIIKGNTKYYSYCSITSKLEAIKQYMADECGGETDWFTEKDMFDIVYEAMVDYLEHCDSPRAFMYHLRDVMMRDDATITERIIIALSLVRVRDEHGYVNGFDDRIHKLKEAN